MISRGALRALLTLVLLVAPPVAGAERVFLVGLDGASWNVMDSLLERGELPHIAQLIARGVQADLATVEPVISPTVWTSIATGRSPEAHGITDFFASARRLRVPTAFERLAALGRRVGLYDYLVTWPPSEVPEGFVIPGWLRRDDRTMPPDVWQRAGVKAFVTDYDSPRTNQDYLDQSRRELDAKAARWNALVRAFRLEVGAVSFYTPDARSHRFWRAAFPDEFDEPGPAVPEGIRTAIVDGYRGVDRALGEITAQLEPEDVILIVSDHGFEASDGPRNVWVTRTGELFALAGLELPDSVRVVGEFGAVAIEVDPVAAPPAQALGVAAAERANGFAARDRSHAAVARALESCRTLEGEPLFDVYRLDIAARPAGFERGLLDRAYQWGVIQVLHYGFGIELDPHVHGVVIARPRDETAASLWPAGRVQVGEREAPIAAVFDHQEFTGTHNPTAVLIAAGGPIVHAPERTQASVLDLAPLVFYLAGEAVPDDLEGRVPAEWLDPTQLAARPIKVLPAVEFPELPRPEENADSPEAKRELEEKLRSLGYLE